MIHRLHHLAGLFIAALIGSMFWPWPALAAPTISMVLSEPTGIHREAADSLARALGREGWNVTLATPEGYSARGSDLTVAIGTMALERALAQPGRPVLSLLVPRWSFERLTSDNRQVSALYLEQPLSRQLQLLTLALPGLTRAAAPLGPTSQGLRTDLQRAAKASGLEIDVAPVNQGLDLYAALTELAKDSQAFLLLPDPVVAQRSTLQNFLLHTYRLKRPVLAYSAPLAQSGALLALYATPAQLGEEAAGWVIESWRNGTFHLGPPRYPRRFSIAINHTVARSLDLALSSEDVLTRKLQAMQ